MFAYMDIVALLKKVIHSVQSMGARSVCFEKGKKRKKRSFVYIRECSKDGFKNSLSSYAKEGNNEGCVESDPS